MGTATAWCGLYMPSTEIEVAVKQLFPSTLKFNMRNLILFVATSHQTSVHKLTSMPLPSDKFNVVACLVSFPSVIKRLE